MCIYCVVPKFCVHVGAMTKSCAVYFDLNSSDLPEYVEEYEGESIDHFEVLPDNILHCILRLLPARTLMAACGVSRRWRRLGRDPSLWTHPRLYFLNLETFCNSECDVRELFRLLRHAPCDSFDRLEMSFGPTDPESLHNAILTDHRSLRSLCIVFSTKDCAKVIALLRKHRLSLEELQIMGYEEKSVSPRDIELDIGGIWHEIVRVESLKSLSVNKALECRLYPHNSGLETLHVESWTNPLTSYLVELNCKSLVALSVGGSYYGRYDMLGVLGSCANLRELTLPCLGDNAFLEDCTQLTHLEIVEGPFTDAPIASFLKKSATSKRLVSLKLRKLDGVIFSALSSEAMPCLRSLSIKECFNISNFADVLRQIPLLEELSLTYSFFHYLQIELVRQIDCHGVLPRLRVLRLDGLCGRGPDGLFELCLHRECRKIQLHRPKLVIFLSEVCYCGRSSDMEKVGNISRLMLRVTKTVESLENIMTDYEFLNEERCSLMHESSRLMCELYRH